MPGLEQRGKTRPCLRTQPREPGETVSNYLDGAGGIGVVVTRALALAMLVTMAGAAAFHPLVADRVGARTRGATAVLSAIAARAGAWASAGFVVMQIPRMALQARGFMDVGDPLWPMVVNMTGTLWGRGWMLQAAAAAVACVGFILVVREAGAGRRRQPDGGRTGAKLGGSRWNGLRIAQVGAFAAVACAPFMGHPAAAERAAWIGVVIDLVHLSSVTVWVGVLAVIVFVSHAPELYSEGGGAVAAMVESFHPVALRAAPLAVAAGAASAFLRLPRVDALWLSSYGQLLLTKTILVSLVLGLGALNSRTAMRRAAAGKVRLAKRALLAEVVFAALTIATTAILVATEPPT